jgi:hypothetical protein
MPPKFSIEGTITHQTVSSATRFSHSCAHHKDVGNWDVESVSGWLKLLKLDDVVETFRGFIVYQHTSYQDKTTTSMGLSFLISMMSSLRKWKLKSLSERSSYRFDLSTYKSSSLLQRLLKIFRRERSLLVAKTKRITALMRMKTRMWSSCHLMSKLPKKRAYWHP